MSYQEVVNNGIKQFLDQEAFTPNFSVKMDCNRITFYKGRSDFSKSESKGSSNTLSTSDIDIFIMGLDNVFHDSKS